MSSEQASAAIEEAGDKMRKAVQHARSEFSTMRTGRASPALVEKLQVTVYGQEMSLQQLAGFQVPEARMLLITPYDRATLGAIEKAIMNSDLGLNPSNDGVSVRLVFPQLTQDRRKELVKRVKNMAEEGRVAVRNVRRDIRKHLDQLEKDGAITEDEKARAVKELDKLTHDQEAAIDKSLAEKEQELLEV